MKRGIKAIENCERSEQPKGQNLNCASTHHIRNFYSCNLHYWG